MTETCLASGTYWPLTCCCRHPSPWWRLNPTSKDACVCSQQGPASCHKIMVSSTFHQIQNNFWNWNILYALFLKSKYITSRTFNDKNWLIIKKVMVLKKLLPHLATRGTYSQGFKGAMKRDVSKHCRTLQWCASSCWVIAWELKVMFGITWTPNILP